ncbi:Aste57867_16425 [Aphanomyces stellatus]|uniref:Aste57867_16425 protein n=1 Tax=Aphanomyces stellatus TaxID=120398 RepID=A0A485L6Z9_9STRA|nr:hypothetical protein As57867_016368 [Aphanomyces stellatus]VFT93200.1 Aste57867_16425 [Aphanomyces stellatus]
MVEAVQAGAFVDEVASASPVTASASATARLSPTTSSLNVHHPSSNVIVRSPSRSSGPMTQSPSRTSMSGRPPAMPSAGSSRRDLPQLVHQGSSALKSLILKGFGHSVGDEQRPASSATEAKRRVPSERSEKQASTRITSERGDKDDTKNPSFKRMVPVQRQATILRDNLSTGSAKMTATALNRRTSKMVRMDSGGFGHKPNAVPDAPDRVMMAGPTTGNASSVVPMLPNQIRMDSKNGAASMFIVAKMKKKAAHMRQSRRDLHQKRVHEAQAIMNRHRKVLQQYNIRTVRATEDEEKVVVLTGRKRLLILPTYTWFKGWQLITLSIVLEQSVYIPYSLSFESNAPVSPMGSPLTNFVSIVFGLDMLFTFNTAISDPDVPDGLITDHWVIAKTYLLGWFWLDLLACLPIDMIVYLVEVNSVQSAGGAGQNGPTSLSIFSLLKILRLPRLLRLARLVRILRLLHIPPELKRWLLYSRYAHLIRVVQLIASFLYCAHVLNCVWNSLGNDWVDDVFPGNTVSNIYVLGFYYTLTTLMGQSIPLRTESEYVFSCAIVVTGALLMAMVFGNVSDLISNFNESSNNYRKKMEQLLSSMNLMRLPLDLQNRINEYYQLMWERHGTLDGQPLLFTNELSKNLAVEVELFVRMDMINRVPVFQKCSKKVVQDLVMNLELNVYLPGDYIIVKGEVGMHMYFVQNGECEVTKASKTTPGDEDVIKRLGQGDYFGEIALLMNCKRTANVRATTFAELCVLSRAVFEDITEKYAEDRAVIENFITEMYDPKVLEAIMKQQEMEKPEKTFHVRLNQQMAEIFDFMEESALRMERLETMMEMLLGLNNKTPPEKTSRSSSISKRRDSTRTSADELPQQFIPVSPHAAATLLTDTSHDPHR